jgi:hypothetical protein
MTHQSAEWFKADSRQNSRIGSAVLSFRLVIDSRLTKTFTGIQVAYFRQ